MLLRAIFLMENMLSNTMNKYLLTIYRVFNVLCRTVEKILDLCLILHHAIETGGEVRLSCKGKRQECELLSVERTGTRPQISQV